jgi:hypothetical protein
MAQKPVLRGEVGARALRMRSVSRKDAWASAGVRGRLDEWTWHGEHCTWKNLLMNQSTYGYGRWALMERC